VKHGYSKANNKRCSKDLKAFSFPELNLFLIYMTLSFALESWAGQAAVDGYCKFWV
jgi:hypothetical protein